MIFPDMPKRRHFWTQEQIDQINHQAVELQAKIKEPKFAEEASAQVSADEWLARYFPDQSQSTPIHREPFDWRQDPVGIAKLCAFVAFMAAWAWYWHQFQ